MYAVPPLISWGAEPLRLPRVMYALGNLHETGGHRVTGEEEEEVERGSGGGESTAKSPVRGASPDILAQRPSKDIEMLETRQLQLLEQLESLQRQMQTMRENFLSNNVAPQSNTVKKTSNVVATTNKNDLPNDIVINASPEHPPYSLLHFNKLAEFKINCHTHSSVTSLTQSAKEFNERLLKMNSTSNPKFNITLIWKNVGAYTELIVSSLPLIICGEVNILRYLVSAIDCPFSYRANDSAWEIDSILDICHQLQTHKTTKERQALIRSLTIRLGKGKWLSGDSKMSVGDIAAWSIIKQSNSQTDLNDNMKNWMKQCDSSVVA